MKFPATEQMNLGDIKVEYERFFSVSLDMLCISSYDGFFKKVNPAFEEVLGFSAEEMCTKSYLHFIHPDDIDPTTREVEKQLHTKQHVLNFENRYRCKDGTYKWLSWKSAPVGDFMYAAARDVTESKVAHEELRKAKSELEFANRELESFSYTVAHDLRAPIRSILGFSHIILEDPAVALETEAKNSLDKVINAAQRMGILIDGLLELSGMARKDLFKRQVNLSAIVQDVVEELRISTSGRKIKFIVAPNIVADCDSSLLTIVIENLLGNAVKYSSNASHEVVIEFGMKEDENGPTFFVRDNGAGFDMNYVSKLFGPFQRLHSAHEFEGTGIGLATVRKIVNRHGGRVWAKAEVNKGATFYFTLHGS